MMQIRYVILIALFLFNSLTVAEQTDRDRMEKEAEVTWHRHIQIVQEDINLIKKTKNRDISIYVRLLELYGEILELYIERENFYLLTAKSDINSKIAELKKSKVIVFNNLLKLSNLLIRKKLDSNILAKIYYYRAENSYLLKDYKAFYRDIKKSEKLSNNEVLNKRINQRLADYYFNEKKYKSAGRYYRQLIKDTKDKWSSKYYYNLGWCFLKLESFPNSLMTFKRAAYLSKKEGFFNIGEQAISSLMFAFVLSKKENEGYSYLENEKTMNFERSLTYLDLVFEHGDKENAVNILKNTVKYIKTAEEMNKYVSSFLVVHRNLKMFQTINDFVLEIMSNELLIKAGGFSEETATNLRAYAGYLQELLRNKTYVKGGLRQALVIYAVNVFESLKQFDIKRSIEYSYFQGEVYLSNENIEKSYLVYKSTMDYFDDKEKVKYGQEYIEKVFKSLFLVISRLGNKPNDLVFVYQKYIQYGSNVILKDQVFKKYLAILSVATHEAFVGVLKKYISQYPNEKESQVGYYKVYVNELVKKRMYDPILALYKEVEKGLLSLGPIEVKKLLTIFKNLILESVDKPVKPISYHQKIEILKNLETKYGIDPIVKDEISSRYLKISYETKNIGDFILYFNNYISFVKKYPKYYVLKRISSYVNIICDYDYAKECKEEIVHLSKKNGFDRVEKRLKERYYYIMLMEGEVEQAYKIGIRVAKFDKTFDYFQPVVKVLLLKSVDEVFKFLEMKQLAIKHRDDVLDMIEDYLIFRYSRDDGEIKYYEKCVALNSSKCNSLEKLILSNQKISNLKMIVPAEFDSKTEVTFESFSKDLGDRMKLVQDQTVVLEQLLKELDPRLQSNGFIKGVSYYEAVRGVFNRFTPVSKEIELVKAINEEMKKIDKIFQMKIVEYERSSKKVRAKINDNTGASLIGLPLDSRDEISTEVSKFLKYMDGI